MLLGDLYKEQLNRTPDKTAVIFGGRSLSYAGFDESVKLTAEALLYLQPERGGLFVDCTVGLAGHARALLEAGATRLIGIDRDPAALAAAGQNLAPWTDRVELVRLPTAAGCAAGATACWAAAGAVTAKAAIR